MYKIKQHFFSSIRSWTCTGDLGNISDKRKAGSVHSVYTTLIAHADNSR